MFRKLSDYNFREIIGHFVLIKNIRIIKDPEEYSYIDEGIESIKQDIIKNTKDYYTNNYGYNEEFDIEETFSLDALNEEMTTRKVTDLYEPVYGYVGIDKMRGCVIYLLGNKEDKLKYVYGLTYWSYSDDNIQDIELEIIDENDFYYAIEFKNQIQDEEERDENILKTRELKELDNFRLGFSPDFVNCIVPFKNIDYSDKVKLERIENNIIYAKYHNIIGIIELVNNDKERFLLFKPIEKTNEKEALKEYFDAIVDGLKKL